MKSLIATLLVVGTSVQAAPIAMKPFIVGGTTTKSNSVIAKSTVGILADGGLCTGSIIGNNWIITAAHCATDQSGNALDPSAITIAYGLKVLNASVTSSVAKVVVYPGYATQNQNPTDEGDVALIKINGSLPSGYQPIAILKDRSELAAGVTVTLAGYGITNGTTQKGAGTLRQVSGIKILNPMLGTTEVVLDQSNGHGACHGDSGGPGYLVDNSGNYFLWGLTDRGYPENAPDDCLHESVYTNMLAYLDWIKKSAPDLQLQ